MEITHKPYTGLLAGAHLFHDSNGSAPQEVWIEYDDGIPYCTFRNPDSEDAGLMLDAREMKGRFVKVRT